MQAPAIACRITLPLLPDACFRYKIRSWHVLFQHTATHLWPPEEQHFRATTKTRTLAEEVFPSIWPPCAYCPLYVLRRCVYAFVKGVNTHGRAGLSVIAWQLSEHGAHFTLRAGPLLEGRMLPDRGLGHLKASLCSTDGSFALIWAWIRQCLAAVVRIVARHGDTKRTVLSLSAAFNLAAASRWLAMERAAARCRFDSVWQEL